MAAPDLKVVPPPEIPVLRGAARLLEMELVPPAFAIEPLFPRGEVCELVGAHGIFKSTLALQACLSVVTGRRFGGLPVTPGRAAFITAEDSEATLARRVRAYLQSVPVGDERRRATTAIRAGFSYLARDDARGMALTLVDYGEPAPRTDTIERLRQLVVGCDLVVLETAARLAEGDENANRTQAAFAMALEEIAQKACAPDCPGPALGIVRHTSKAAALEGRADSYVGRGGGALSDAARSVIVFTRPSPKGDDEPNPLAPVVMTHAKSTLTRPAGRIQWQPVEIQLEGNGPAVYLRPLSEDETARANAQKLLAACPPEGFTSTILHKRPPAGLSRKAAREAFEFLVEAGQLSEVDRPHGSNRQPVKAYVPAEGKE
jgi:hypothetical protein